MIAPSQLLATFLLNSIWQIPLIAAVAALGSKLMRGVSSAYRHLVWVAALALCLGLPLATTWSSTSERSSVHPVALRPSGGDIQHLLTHQRFSLIGKSHIRPVKFTPVCTLLLGGGYLGFVLFRVAGLCFSLRRTLRFRGACYGRALPIPFVAIAERCSAAFSLRNVAITCSRQAVAPLTLTFPGPMLILPERFFTAVSESDFSSALCHEFAHIKRRDFLFNLFYEAGSLPICFHPVVIWIKNRIALTRESACDEAAAAQARTRITYVRSLLAIAESSSFGSAQESPSWALGLFDTDTLEERIMNLLGKKTRWSKKWSLVLAALAATLLALTCIGASAFSFQVTPPPASSSADTQQFVGTWTAMHDGTRLMVLELHLEKGNLVGGMKVCSFNINTEDTGEVIEITDKTLTGSLPARSFVVSGRSLSFDWKDPDGDETHWKLELNGAASGRLHWMQLPGGLKALPIPVTRESTKTS